MPEVAHSNVEEHFGGNIERIDFNPFLKGRRTPVSVEFNMRSGFLSVDLKGKPQMSMQVKSLLEGFENWYNFSHDGHKFTLKKEVDTEGDETGKLELLIDAISYF